MENDDYLPQGRSGFKVLVVMLGFLLAGLAWAGYIQGVKERTASEERMYVACLTKLVNPEHANYAAQLTACKTGS